MFTIDLLKGEGVPVRSGPGGIFAAVVTFMLPAVIALIMLGCYLSGRISLSIHKQQIAKYQRKINGLSDAIKIQESFEFQQNTIRACLLEVTASVGRHMQWSPILVTVAENMPDSMVLTGCGVKLDSETKQVPMKDDPEKLVWVSMPVRTLQMSLSGNPQHDHNKAVWNFKERLSSSSVLGPRLKDIKVFPRFEKQNGRDVVFYDIDCIFKPEL